MKNNLSNTRSQPIDSLFKTPYKSYADFIDELDGDTVFEGLLGQGLFGDKVPPILTGEPFCEHVCKSQSNSQDARHDWIRYRYTRNVNRFREFGIPNPFAYARLAKHIRDHWSEIATLLKGNTAGQPYRVSRIHPRKQRNNKCIFEMNYKNWRVDADPMPTILIGKRYVVHCDISRCFPSIYTHTIEWAAKGREAAKGSKRKELKSWDEKLDHYVSQTTYGETHGLLIGPHSSNLIAELILTCIDRKLFEDGYRFVRNIDDYECYVESHDEAEKFVVDLERQLSEFRLSLNQQKTSIVELPNALSASWVRTLKNHPFDDGSLSYRDVQSFLDLAVDLMKKENENAAVLLYAFKVIAGKPMKKSASKYYADMACHLVLLYPYLVPYMEEQVFKPTKMGFERIAVVSKLLYDKAVANRDYLTACYALYFAIKYRFALPSVSMEEIVKSDDCLLKLFAFLYAENRGDEYLCDELKRNAEAIAKAFSEDSAEFDRNWLFVYEVLPANKLPTGEWKNIKRKKISFVNMSAFDLGQTNADIADEVDGGANSTSIVEAGADNPNEL